MWKCGGGRYNFCGEAEEDIGGKSQGVGEHWGSVEREGRWRRVGFAQARLKYVREAEKGGKGRERHVLIMEGDNSSHTCFSIWSY